MLTCPPWTPATGQAELVRLRALLVACRHLRFRGSLTPYTVSLRCTGNTHTLVLILFLHRPAPVRPVRPPYPRRWPSSRSVWAVCRWRCARPSSPPSRCPWDTALGPSSWRMWVAAQVWGWKCSRLHLWGMIVVRCGARPGDHLPGERGWYLVVAWVWRRSGHVGAGLWRDCGARPGDRLQESVGRGVGVGMRGQQAACRDMSVVRCGARPGDHLPGERGWYLVVAWVWRRSGHVGAGLWRDCGARPGDRLQESVGRGVGVGMRGQQAACRDMSVVRCGARPGDRVAGRWLRGCGERRCEGRRL